MLVLGVLSLPGFLVPPGDVLIPDYPRGVSARSVLDSLQVSSWDELLEATGERLRADPGDGEALRLRGMALLGLKRPADARATFLRQADADYRKPNAFYNAACATSKLGDVEEAIGLLERAYALGGMAPEALLEDPDLDPLREHPRFRELVDDLFPTSGEPAE